MAWSKETFSINLKRYMNDRGITQKELSEIVGVSAPTVNDWIKAKKYPRIDKVEKMADYFGILKSDLIEEKPESYYQMQKNNDILADIVIRMRNDQVLFEATTKLARLDKEALASIVKLLDDPELIKTAALISALDEDKKAGIKTMVSAFLK